MSEKIRPQAHTIPAAYEPDQFEKLLYNFWENNKCFKAFDENDPGQKSFCIVIPPPNVTGALHMGHALTNTIQDILTRWHRMKGDNTLWLPGTDHAGIATQTQVEKDIAKTKNAQGRPTSRHDLGREKFLEKVWEWKELYGGKITNQLRRLGSSVDWDRERFTMDEGLSNAVREVFVQLYEEKLIYRGERIINWCPRCQSALSDLEVEPTDRKGSLWHISYPIEGSSETLTVATTRPETMLGDTAVAVHPDDERYHHLRGKKVKLPLIGRTIPIVEDSYVEKEFGTGVVKITPAHDFNDYEVGKRHNLPFVQVMGKAGRMTEEAGNFSGLKYAEAREKVVEALKEQGLLVKVEDHAMKVGLCQRCDTVAEPIISKQWFVKIEPLAKPAIAAVETGKVTFTPKTWEKTYFEWMYNIRDWCISRQLWWGHQIPAWYCSECEGVTVERTTPKECSQCRSKTAKLTQDEDVLDTWFSSGLWPFSTLGWPEQTKSLHTFYPTSIMETGFDIIFFWVARMMMFGLHFMEQVPFHKVYLHAMVRDEKGHKMSKTKGNVIDPLDVIKEHGADPLRFTLAIMAGQGRDIKLAVSRVEGYRAFCNKIWNANKFFHMNLETRSVLPPLNGTSKWIESHSDQLSPINKWILSRLQTLAQTVENGFADFELNVSTQSIYDFAWGEFCDWYVELSKVLLKGTEDQQKETLYVYHHVLEELFKLSHPIIPFVTEEMWQQLPWKTDHHADTNWTQKTAAKGHLSTIMLQRFPEKNSKLVNLKAEEAIGALKQIISAFRNLRGENNISPKAELEVSFVSDSKETDTLVENFRTEIITLAKLKSLQKTSKGNASESQALVPIPELKLTLQVELKGVVDFEEELKRIEKELLKVGENISHIDSKLSKESFMAKAPAELVEQEKAKRDGFLQKRKELESAQTRVKKFLQ